MKRRVVARIIVAGLGVLASSCVVWFSSLFWTSAPTHGAAALTSHSRERLLLGKRPVGETAGSDESQRHVHGPGSRGDASPDFQDSPREPHLDESGRRLQEGATAAAQERFSPPMHIDADLPWARAGQCGPGDLLNQQERERYLGGFEPREASEANLFVHPDVPLEVVRFVAVTVEQTHAFAVSQLARNFGAPTVFLHPNVESLRQQSCAGSTAVAYYDGAIHLALRGSAPGSSAPHDSARHSSATTSWLHHNGSTSDPVLRDLKTSLRHEYAHHVLAEQGIGRPMWLQEGLAMNFAHEQPPDTYALWRAHPVDLEKMSAPIDRRWSPTEVEVFYAQSLAMFEFVDGLCLGKPGCGNRELIEEIVRYRVHPDDVFFWATERRGADVISTSAAQLWRDYEAEGNFPLAAKRTLLVRGRGAAVASTE